MLCFNLKEIDWLIKCLASPLMHRLPQGKKSRELIHHQAGIHNSSYACNKSPKMSQWTHSALLVLKTIKWTMRLAKHKEISLIEILRNLETPNYLY